MAKAPLDSSALRNNISLSMADVIGLNSSLFVKSSGRASLSTVSFRGAAPSHTSVSWNGMEINNPSLGMTDFSLIPAYLIDEASLVSGPSATGDNDGALGGAVVLNSRRTDVDGLRLQYVQGIGSFTTFDEFLRFDYGRNRLNLTTRAVVSSSKNDFPYTNHDRKVNVYDDNHNIIDSYYPRERNRNGGFCDIHVMQDLYYSTPSGHRIGLNAWLTLSRRNTPMLTTDYASTDGYQNVQRHQNLRALLSWRFTSGDWRFEADGGYIFDRSTYSYSRDPGDGTMSRLIDSRSRVNTVSAKGDVVWQPSTSLAIRAELAVRHHFASMSDLASLASGPVNYSYRRAELTAALKARWQATDGLGLGVTLRDELYGSKNAFVPALTADFVLHAPTNLTLRGAVARNYHFPSLNDLYYLPGGNPDLRPERGLSYDLGAGFSYDFSRAVTFGARATWYESFIDDWILWLPDIRGFFRPRNVKSVKSYGIEGNLDLGLRPSRHWHIDLAGSISWTPSVNTGEPFSEGDMSVGKQLPYVPKLSLAAGLEIGWRSWSAGYNWRYYSRRYTMSSNEDTFYGSLRPYFMSDINVAKRFEWRPLDLSLKLAVNNLFNADYQTIMSRPMPGINFEFFVSIIPKL